MTSVMSFSRVALSTNTMAYRPSAHRAPIRTREKDEPTSYCFKVRVSKA